MGKETIKIGQIEREYGIKFNVRSDMKLSTYLEKEGLPSLSRALKKIQTFKSNK